MPGGQSTLFREDAFLFRSSQQLPRLCLALEGLFELTDRPSKALKLTSCVASRTTEKQGHLAMPGGPRTLSLTADTNLDYALVENTLVYTEP